MLILAADSTPDKNRENAVSALLPKAHEAQQHQANRVCGEVQLLGATMKGTSRRKYIPRSRSGPAGSSRLRKSAICRASSFLCPNEEQDHGKKHERTSRLRRHQPGMVRVASAAISVSTPRENPKACSSRPIAATTPPGLPTRG